jgi:hypothetical protein
MALCISYLWHARAELLKLILGQVIWMIRKEALCMQYSKRRNKDSNPESNNCDIRGRGDNFGFIKKTTSYGIEKKCIYSTYYPLSSTHL